MPDSSVADAADGEPRIARDPLVERLVGPGRLYEVETVAVRGVAQQVFKGAPRTLAAIYRKAMAFEDRTLIVHGSASLSYGEVFRRAAALSRALRETYRVEPGSKVALILSNRLEWVVAFLAVTAAGGIAVLINSRGVAEEIAHAMDTVGCDLSIVDAEHLAQTDPAWRRIVIGGGTGAPLHGQDADFADLSRAEDGAVLAPVAVSPDDGAVILYTSGTTGRPKGALLSHGALAHAVSLSAMMGALQDLRYEEETGGTLAAGQRTMAGPAMVLTPMFHLTGMLPVIRGISLGAPIHIMTKWNADVAFDMIERSGLSRMAFVPTMLWDMLNSPRCTPEALSAIRNLAYGGAPISLELIAEVHRRLPRALITNTYGQSENAGWACSLSGEPYLAHPSSCGWACPTIEVAARRDDGSAAATGEPGELWVRSASIMTEYVGDPDATAATLQDGWCATGDIGTVDEAGLFTIVGRKKDMVISGGENVYCAEVERVLYDHPAVRETIVYGRPDPRLGERVVATVVQAPLTEISEGELVEYCRQRLAIYKTPRQIIVRRDLLPRTAAGKIDRPAFLRSLP